MVLVIYTQGVTGSNPVSPTIQKFNCPQHSTNAFVHKGFTIPEGRGIFFESMVKSGQERSKAVKTDNE
jgi:hypothetical protein